MPRGDWRGSRAATRQPRCGRSRVLPEVTPGASVGVARPGGCRRRAPPAACSGRARRSARNPVEIATRAWAQLATSPAIVRRPGPIAGARTGRAWTQDVDRSRPHLHAVVLTEAVTRPKPSSRTRRTTPPRWPDRSITTPPPKNRSGTYATDPSSLFKTPVGDRGRCAAFDIVTDPTDTSDRRRGVPWTSLTPVALQPDAVRDRQRNAEPTPSRRRGSCAARWSQDADRRQRPHLLDDTD